MSEFVQPRLGANVYIAPTAYVGGDVVIGDQSTLMHHVVVRGDVAPIRIGAHVGIQDGAIVHTDKGTPLELADDVGLGHRAVVHCRKIGPRTLIGIGAIVLDDCEIGSCCVIAAGTVVTPGTIVPDGSVMMGVPGVRVRDVTDRDLATIDEVIQSYLDLNRLHTANLFPNITNSRPNAH